MYKISIFKKFTTVIAERTLEQVITAIRGEHYKPQVLAIREAVEKGDIKRKDFLKKQLHAFTVSGRFKGGRTIEALVEYQPFVILDIDKLDVEKVEWIQNEVQQLPFTYAGFVSPSGRGYKVIVKTNAKLETHREAFEAVANYYEEKLAIPIDRSGKDVTRLCFLSYDPKAYYNADAEIFEIEKMESQVVTIPYEDYQYAYEECISMTEEQSKYIEGNRNNHIFQLAVHCNRAGIPEEIVKKFSNQKFDLSNREIERTIQSCYQGAKRKFLKTGLNGHHHPLDFKIEFPRPFPQKIYDGLPDLLREACTHFKNGYERDVFLTGALAVLSGCLPKVQGWYDNRVTYPNLYTFIIAPAASGKGVLKFAKEMGMGQHNSLLSKNHATHAAYKKAMKEYERECIRFRKGEIEEEPNEPELEPTKTLFIPANSSSAKLIKQLRNNDGNGILFESEADTLGNVLKQDWGGYSDVLRKAAHHECVSYSRSGNDELVELQNPRLSVCLSGTPNQVSRLIPSVEDGLFSRFLFYYFDIGEKWRSIKTQKPKGRIDQFHDVLAQEVKAIITFLEKHPTHFSFREDQDKLFNSCYNDSMEKVNKEIGKGALSIVKRSGFMTFRIAMLLSAIKKYQSQHIEQEIVCSDNDFHVALWITEVYLEHALFVYNFLPQNSHSSFRRRQEEIATFYGSLPIRFKRKEALRKGSELGFSRAKVDRLLHFLVPKYLNRLANKEYGHYEKVENKKVS